MDWNQTVQLVILVIALHWGSWYYRILHYQCARQADR